MENPFQNGQTIDWIELKFNWMFRKPMFDCLTIFNVQCFGSIIIIIIISTWLCCVVASSQCVCILEMWSFVSQESKVKRIQDND